MFVLKKAISAVRLDEQNVQQTIEKQWIRLLVTSFGKTWKKGFSNAKEYTILGR